MAAKGTEYDLDYLLQTEVIDKLLPSLGTGQWSPIYVSRDRSTFGVAVHAALLTAEAAEHALQRDNWDVSVGDGRPGFSQRWEDDAEVLEYHRYGSVRDGFRPLAVYREFAGAFPAHFDVDEEFRHYHDLAHDTKAGRLLDFDSSGREIEVGVIGDTKVVVLTRYLREFQAGKQMHLAFYVDSTRYSKIRVEDIPNREMKWESVTDTSHLTRYVGSCDFRPEYESLSRVMGKVILPPPELSSAGIWPFEPEESREVPFIIGTDDMGRPVEYSSNPDGLGNYFGGSPDAPHYLTPVFFRREVLSKYYSESDRYTVSDGRLSCLCIWSCQIDNDLGDVVAVFLGDLGRDMPYEERLHWRQYNVASDRGVSETTFRRSFLNQFTDPTSADLVFKRLYSEVSRDWQQRMGWPLYLPLHDADSHILEAVRIPTTESQSEMDEQVLFLTKLMVDSLNEAELEGRAGALPQNVKGIGKLEAYLKATDFPFTSVAVGFLRDVQQLRSTGSGHRKGSKYERTLERLGISSTSSRTAIESLLSEAIRFLEALDVVYLSSTVEAGETDSAESEAVQAG